MTGPTMVEAAAPDTAPSTPADRQAPPPGSPAFVHLLAQLLEGIGGPAVAPLAQKIGDAPDGLEGEAKPETDSPHSEQSAASPLAGFAMELTLLAPPPPSVPAPAEQDGALAAVLGPKPAETPPAAEAAIPAAGSGPEAPPMTRPAVVAPTAKSDFLPGLKQTSMPETSAESVRSQEAAPRASHIDRPATSAVRASIDVPTDAAPLTARVEELSSTTPRADGAAAAPEARSEAAFTVGAPSYGESRGSGDRDGARDRDRDGREPVSPLERIVSGPNTSESQPVPAATETSTRSAAAAPSRPPVEQVAERVTLAHREGRQEVSFRLDPPELGAVRIQAVLEGQRLILHIRTEQESARAALEQALPQLKESLSQQGIVAGRVTVELGLDTSPRGFTREGFAGFSRQEPAEPPAPSRDIVVRSQQRHEPATGGFDLWV